MAAGAAGTVAHAAAGSRAWPASLDSISLNRSDRYRWMDPMAIRDRAKTNQP